MGSIYLNTQWVKLSDCRRATIRRSLLSLPNPQRSQVAHPHRRLTGALFDNQPTLFYSMSINAMPTTMPKPSKPLQRNLFRGALEIMILQSLRCQPMHGYALVQNIKERSNDSFQVEEGSLYPALQRMLKEEFAKAEWKISETNRKVRIYKNTPSGIKHSEREVFRFERMLEGISPVLSPAKS